ncbi:efflux RND transporter periplasmic adaptor subunit [Shewanella fidelis]|uniref:Efflux RND transporter periplasmic adaptor subunit n=1 Tax=Shewanella fidelis TaxID=173509 RepID=A0AAW8NQP8_9GAMM|nr:efflux RND transporter periplasmic adaptor subunit [Shewanella fidelis]MDR8525027.1 efflux RND transporter periplasmic adaptor subunit [Shewanella fidelis]MDW4811098.1 efflux RND transporter periplasmic adaptor subunit [Shewanella fidelis]MDW4815123.1 efflux RND transporter periplasmic adaptor subunit [Shewanella fidelis]MDW4819213.1 efflux RND transporter periplasmic adaptor subunit [Shewanella fidelis]MDW4823109.1 efflux RND transporter periplasmic adaptor subunit [Shewanella fidelis]
MSFNIKTIIRRMMPLFILTAFLIAAVILIGTKQAPEQKADEAPLPVIDVTQVEQQTVSLNLPSYGVVTPKYKTQLVTEVQGRMLSISANFVAGGVVKKGDELAVIEPSDYEADLMQAQASLAQAEAALEEERAKGEVAKNDWKGYDGGVPPELGLRLPQLKQEQANVKFQQAALARAQRNLERTVIRAPFDGIIKARNVDLGQYVTLGTNLGELYDTQIAEVRLPLSNNDLAYLESVDNPDTDVSLSADLAGKTITWHGQIIRSEGVIDAENRMVYLVAEIKDPYLRKQRDEGQLPLKYGTFVTAVIKGRTVSGIVKLPRHLVRNNQVTVVNNDNSIELRDVNIVKSDLESVYIKDSLADGERISLTNLTNAENGQIVKILGEQSNSSQDDATEISDAEQLASAGAQ